MLFEVLATPFIVLLSSLDARMETGESDRSERLPSAEEVDDAVERQCGETTDTGSESADDTLDDAKALLPQNDVWCVSNGRVVRDLDGRAAAKGSGNVFALSRADVSARYTFLVSFAHSFSTSGHW